MKMSKMSAAALAAVLAVSAPVAVAANNAVSVAASAEETTESISENGLSYTVKSDGSLALRGANENLTEINIPSEVQGKSVTEIDYRFFHSISQMGKYVENYDNIVLNIPDSVTTISSREPTEYDPIPFKEINVSAGNEAYCSEDGVLFTKDKKEIVLYPSRKTDTSYAIPDGVEIISVPSFYGCKNLTSITIPNSVKWLDLEAFLLCEKLTSLDIPASIEHINQNVYYDCPDRYEFPDGTVYDISYRTMSDGIRVYHLQDDHGYYSYMGLFGCESLTEINVDKNNKFFYSEDGVLFYKDYEWCNYDEDIVNYDDKWEKVLVKYPPAKSKDYYTIPDDVKVVDGAFLDCYNTKVLVVPTETTYRLAGTNWSCENWVDALNSPDFITDIYYCGTQEEWEKHFGEIYGAGGMRNYTQELHFNFNPATDKPVQTVTVEKPEPSEPTTSDPETSDPETSDPETSDPETSDPETSEPTTSDPTTSDTPVTPGDTDKTPDEDKQETIDATLKNVDSENGLSGEELEKQLFGDSGWTWAQTEKIEFTSDKLFSVQYTATDGSTKTLGEQTAARAEDGIWSTAWTLDTSLLSKDKPSVKLIAKDGTADITAKVFIKKGAEKPSTDTEKPSNSDQKPSNSDQKPSNSDQKPTGIALAIAPVVLAAGAVIVTSKKRK